VQGAQISAPNGKYAAAVDVLEALGVGMRERQSTVFSPQSSTQPANG